jgi:hypothetical protein
VQRELGVRRAARERELEEARLEKQRKEKIAAALKNTRWAASDEAAVAILTEALALEPSHPKLRELLAKREAALQRARAGAAREQEIAAVREKALQLVAIGQFDAAAAALSDAESRLSARKALEDVSRSLARARAAAAQQERPAEASTADRQSPSSIRLLFGYRAGVLGAVTTRLGLRPSQVAAAAVILISVFAVAAYFALGRSSDEVSTAASDVKTSAVERPPVSDGPVPPASEREQQLPSPAAPPPGPAEAAATTDGGATAAASPTVAGGTDSQAAVTAALRLAQQQVGQGDFRGALTTAAGGLKTDPQNTALKALVRDVAARARQQANAAQTSAARLGEAVTGLRAFRDGQAKMNEAQGYARAGRQDRAAASLWDATDLFALAEREAAEARARAAAAAAAAPAPASASAETQPPVAAREEPVAAKPLPLPPPAPSPTPAPAPPPAASSSPAASPTPSPSSEEPAIRAALQAYEEAYIARDVEAVKRIYPTVNEAALKRSFSDMLAQEVRIEAQEISITGNTAVVTGRVRQSFTPRAGSRRTDVIASVFRLQKMGNRWVIVERR